jgi:predicted GIY-YIG superfamily endonuclease
MPRSTIAEHEGAFVYIVRCSDGSYYTGRSSVSVEKRVSEHNLGVNDGYTKIAAARDACLLRALRTDNRRDRLRAASQGMEPR